MNAQQLLQWIQQHQPDWESSNNMGWVIWALKNSPHKDAIANAVAGQIGNGENNPNALNQAAHGAVDQIVAGPAKNATTSAMGMPGSIPVPVPTSPQQQQPNSAPETSIQDIQNLISHGGDMGFFGRAIGQYPYSREPKDQVDAAQLFKYIQSLPANDQQIATNSIMQFLKQRSGTTPLRQKDVWDARDQAVRDVSAAAKSAKRPDPNKPAGPSGFQPPKGMSAAMAEVTRGWDQQAESGARNMAVSPRMVETLAELYGVNADQMAQTIQTMAKQQQVQVSNINTHQTATWTKGQVGAQPLAPGWYVSGTAAAKPGQGSSYSQVMYAMLHGADSAKLLAGLETLRYAEANNVTDLSTLSGLRTQLENRVHDAMSGKLSPTEKNDVYASLNTIRQDSSSIVAGVASGNMPNVSLPGWLNAMSNEYGAEHPSAMSQREQLIAKIQTITGTGYTPPETVINNLLGKPDSAIHEFWNTLPDPRHPGFTYGTWENNYNGIVSQWTDAFGGKSAPNDSQVATLMGMTDVQRQNWIDAAPMPGMDMNHGQYKDYSNTLNKVRDDLPATLGTDFMNQIKTLGKAQ